MQRGALSWRTGFIALALLAWVSGCAADHNPVGLEYGSGTVVVVPSPDSLQSTWVLIGPDSYSRDGVGVQALLGRLPGRYTITWGDSNGSADTSGETKILSPVGAITFTQTLKERDPVARQFDVKDFGAAGDGITDDYQAIQAAIDACAGGGLGELSLPAGSYLIGEVLSLKGGVRLIGYGANLVTVANTTHIDIPPGASDVKISGIQFKTRNSKRGTDGRAAVRINSAEMTPAPFDIEVSDCTFTDLAHCAVSGALCTDVWVINNLIRNVGEHGVYAAAGADRWMISGNIIEGADVTRDHHAGIKITGMGVTVSNNTISDVVGTSSSFGIVVEYSNGPVSIIGNQISGCREGARIGYTSNVSIYANLFRDNLLDGYYGDVTFRSAPGDGNGLSNITISSNSFFGSSGNKQASVFYHVDSETAESVLISGNTVGGAYIDFFGGSNAGFEIVDNDAH
jgi:parallel beta-helix repeat protein